MSTSKTMTGEVTPLTKPLTLRQLRRRVKAGRLTAHLLFRFDELNVSRDRLNDCAALRIADDPTALEDLFYQPIGVVGRQVLVAVHADVQSWLKRVSEREEAR